MLFLSLCSSLPWHWGGRTRFCFSCHTQDCNGASQVTECLRLSTWGCDAVFSKHPYVSMLGKPASQIPIYREETKPNTALFTPTVMVAMGSLYLQSRIMAVVPTRSGGHRAAEACGTLSKHPYWGVDGHLQSSQEERCVRNSLQWSWSCRTYPLWYRHSQSNKNTCQRTYRKLQMGNWTPPETYTNIKGDYIPSPGHHGTSHPMSVQPALCDSNIKDRRCSQENYEELALFISPPKLFGSAFQ